MKYAPFLSVFVVLAMAGPGRAEPYEVAYYAPQCEPGAGPKEVIA